MSKSTLSRETIEAAVVAAVNVAARRAWRQLQPEWERIEAGIALAAASNAILAAAPRLTEGELLAELVQFGIVEPGANGSAAVRVPGLPGEPERRLPAVSLQ